MGVGPNTRRPVRTAPGTGRRAWPSLDAAQVFVAVVAGLGIVLAGLVWLHNSPWTDLLSTQRGLLLLSIFLVLGELSPIPVSRGDDTVSEITISTTFAVALVVLGPLALVLAVHTVAVLVDDLRGRRGVDKILFNFGQYVLTLVAARLVFCAVSGVPVVGDHRPFEAGHLLAALAAGVAFVVVNDGLVAVVVALHNRMPVLGMMREDLAFKVETSGVLVCMGPLAAAVVDVTPWLVPIICLPILAVRRSAHLAVQRERQALRDTLTGLANRELFRQRAHRALVARDHAGGKVAIYMIDLDHFKEVNDTLGHQVGDDLIQEAAARLRDGLPSHATVARLGGDEFAVVLPDVEGRTHVTQVADDLLRVLDRPMTAGEVRLVVQASVGVSMAPDHGTDVHTLMKRADIALYDAKRNRGTWAVYEPEEDNRTPERLLLLGELRHALDAQELTVVFQPQLDLSSGRVVGMEALTRWQHPDRGAIPPEEFIPLAESAGLIAPITSFVLDEALRVNRHWLDLGLEVTTSVNMSVRHLSDVSLPERVSQALEKHRVPPRLLTIEMTEGSIMSDPRRAIRVLRELRALGVSLAVDDFGTGYSSLAYLQRLEVDELKIDKSFVTNMTVNPGDRIIVRSTVDLGHNLGLRIIAEGVEDPDTLAQLRALGCDRAQGWVTGRPMTAAQADDHLLREALDLRPAATPVRPAPVQPAR